MLIPMLRLWRADLRIPFKYDSDTLFNLMLIKGILKHGWWLENPDLGAPFNQELYDFPAFIGDGFHFLLIKLLGVFSSDPSLVLNLFFLLSFPLVALASFLALRQLRISGGVALVCSVLYALAPYHFLRGEIHLLLAAYYSVPVGAYLILSTLSRKPLFTRRTHAGPRMLSWASKRSVVTLALCLFSASAGSTYYAVFTTILLIVAAVLILVTQRDTRVLLQAAIAVGVILGSLALYSLPIPLYWYANGTNNAAAQRGPEDSEVYGLNLTQMVMPLPGHRLKLFSSLGDQFYQEHKILAPGGRPWQSLGLVATLGFAWLLLVALAGCLSPRFEISDPRHRQVATAAVATFLVGTTGGISSLFASLVSPQIRCWHRLSIFVAFFAIAAVALLLDALRERLRTERGGQMLVAALLISVLLVGIYDQTVSSFVPDYQGVKEEYTNDAVFAKAIAREMPPQAEVLQLPYSFFPESGPIDRMNPYEPLRAYFPETTLRWSYGTMKGRPADAWEQDLANKSPAELVSEAIDAGFDGIYVDRFGYPDNAANLEGELGELLGVEPLVSPNGRISFFSLLPYKERLQEAHIA